MNAHIFHAVKTSRGWEIADETGTCCHEADSKIYATHGFCAQACDSLNSDIRRHESTCGNEDALGLGYYND